MPNEMIAGVLMIGEV